MSHDAQSAIARAKQIIAQRQAEKQARESAKVAELEARYHFEKPTATSSHAPLTMIGANPANAEQQAAIDAAFFGKSFNLIGAAGTGKTSTLKAILQVMIEQNRLPMIERDTGWLRAGTPGVALIAYTRRAVRNIAKQMPDDLKKHCLTFHKLVEYQPEQYEVETEDGWQTRMRFAPKYNRDNRLPRGLHLIIVDEASMLSIDYFMELLAALPDPTSCQFIFLGDLNQIPPVYGLPILAQKLLELPVIELTRVYRQALESPIIALATAIRTNDFSSLTADIRSGIFTVAGIDDVRFLDFKALPPGKITIEKAGRGKVTLHVWKKKLDWEDGLFMGQQQLCKMIKDAEFNPEDDVFLCPWKVKFGSEELNRAVAEYLGKQRGAEVYEVISGFMKHYFAVGDRLMIEKQEAIILEIRNNPRYLGALPKTPSKELTRWGVGGTAAQINPFDESLSEEQIEALLAAATTSEDRTNEASHSLRVRFLDSGTEEYISAAGSLNASSFGYGMSVHQSQGSEYPRVLYVTSHIHSAMLSRELAYTGVTRASQELYWILESTALGKAAKSPRIKGESLAEKIAFFEERVKEKHGKIEVSE
jgi:ATP-dependent exoDNAse (exonuclease V) alpha subunit